MKEEYLILVDKEDNQIGSEEKVKCHLPDGKLHRAFTALLFNEDGKLLLTQRSQNKMLWPGIWDGTFASHPRESETYVSSAERRMPEEVGISSKLEYLFKFEYHVKYKNVGSENEICGTLIGFIKNSTTVNLVEDEISQVKWLSANELLSELEKNPEYYCPWMLVAIYLMSDSVQLEKYGDKLNEWLESDLKNKLLKPLEFHFPNSDWRLVN